MTQAVKVGARVRLPPLLFNFPLSLFQTCSPESPPALENVPTSPPTQPNNPRLFFKIPSPNPTAAQHPIHSPNPKHRRKSLRRLPQNSRRLNPSPNRRPRKSRCLARQDTSRKSRCGRCRSEIGRDLRPSCGVGRWCEGKAS